ncbi:hypothetical protein ABZ341_38090 [Streptomyces sp. NPDC006173]|uniref:hypothetical protein n=1 Tax=Streptomyces sp. NPDC006173 TaxID=3155349 RepID=UPI0033E4ADBE
MRIAPRTRLYAAMALVFGCAMSAGGYAGFRVVGLWGFHAGAALAAGALLLGVGISIQLCDLQTNEVLDRLLQDDVRTEATTEAALAAVTLYQAAVFPLTSEGVSVTERRARRTAAYRMAADEHLPRPIQVAAAAALEAIDQGDAKSTTTELIVLRRTTRAYRVGHLREHDGQLS